jgi:hypothetical protein
MLPTRFGAVPSPVPVWLQRTAILTSPGSETAKAASPEARAQAVEARRAQAQRQAEAAGIPAARPPVIAPIVPPPAMDITQSWVRDTVPTVSRPYVPTVPVVNREASGRTTVTPQIIAPTTERAAAGPPLARVPIVAPTVPPAAPDATMPTRAAVTEQYAIVKRRVAERKMLNGAQAQRNGETGTAPLMEVTSAPLVRDARVIIPNADRTGTTTAPVTRNVRIAARAEAAQMTSGPDSSPRAAVMTAPTVQEARAADASGTGQPDATVAAQAAVPSFDGKKLMLPLAFLGILLLLRK